MLHNESVIAVFSELPEANAAVQRLLTAGVAADDLSVVGKGCHSDEKVVGFQTTAGRIKFWGKRGPFWSNLWSVFSGGVLLTLPFGNIMVLGYVAPIVVSAVEGAILTGGLSTLGAALYSAGIPRDGVVQYEQAVRANGFLVIVHGAVEQLRRAQTILAEGSSRLDLHRAMTATLLGLEPAVAAPAILSSFRSYSPTSSLS
jgi:hypothetical protein